MIFWLRFWGFINPLTNELWLINVPPLLCKLQDWLNFQPCSSLFEQCSEKSEVSFEATETISSNYIKLDNIFASQLWLIIAVESIKSKPCQIHFAVVFFNLDFRAWISRKMNKTGLVTQKLMSLKTKKVQNDCLNIDQAYVPEPEYSLLKTRPRIR